MKREESGDQRSRQDKTRQSKTKTLYVLYRMRSAYPECRFVGVRCVEQSASGGLLKLLRVARSRRDARREPVESGVMLAQSRVVGAQLRVLVETLAVRVGVTSPEAAAIVKPLESLLNVAARVRCCALRVQHMRASRETH